MRPADEMGEPFKRQVLSIQIVKASLILGVLAFAGYVLVAQGPREEAKPLPLAGAMALFGGAAILARIVVPRSIVKTGIRQIAVGKWRAADGKRAGAHDDEQLAGLYQTQMILGTALLEGAAFGNLIACLLADSLISWIVSGLLIAGMVIDFPTRLAIERWVAAKRMLVQDERRLSGRFDEG